MNVHLHVYTCTYMYMYIYIRNANNIIRELNNRERRLYIFTFILDTSNFSTHQAGLTMHNSRSLLQCRDFGIIMHGTCTAETKCDPISKRNIFLQNNFDQTLTSNRSPFCHFVQEVNEI